MKRFIKAVTAVFSVLCVVIFSAVAYGVSSLPDEISITEKNSTNFGTVFSLKENEQVYPALKGEKGDDGTDGREIELRVVNGMIQWRYANPDDPEIGWENLLEVEGSNITIEAKDGEDGEDGEMGIMPGEEDTAEAENGSDKKVKTNKKGVVTFTIKNSVYKKLSATRKKLKFYLEENKANATSIVEKMLKSRMVREAARKARDEARQGKDKNKKERALSGKLAPAQTKNPKKNELFLVEGDSAGGSAKGGRDRKFQAILPLRGKVINTEKAKMDEILKNEEINTMIHTIGAGVGSDFTIEDSNYDKVIIMTDADDDGAHIQILLITFFYRYMKPLIEAGKLYIALPPLYKVDYGKKHFYAWTDEDLEQIRSENSGKPNVQRYKGLGEMNADQLWETTMNPDTRALIRVNIIDGALAEKRVSVLMGDKVDPRKEWIDENVEKVKALKPDMVFWPVYTDFNPNKWNNQYKYEYAHRAGEICKKVLLVNSYYKDKNESDYAKGGAAFFYEGNISKEVPAGIEAILFGEI